MPGQIEPQLGRLIGVPIAVIGVLAAVLTSELQRVSSASLGFAIVAGGVVACVIVARRVRAKIDELSAYYEALLRTADEQSQRAEAANQLKDDFLATLSHELRTPLNSVLGWARILASGKLDAHETTKAIQAIERAGWAQSRLIEDLLDISRIVGGKLRIETHPTLIPPLVDAAVESLRTAAAAKRIVIETDLDATIGPFPVDADRLQQVVWNVLSNAIKFTRSGGHVRVWLRRDDRQQLLLTVSDDGIGFEPEVATHLFERFRQGDSSPTRQYGGLGLGLGIVRHLIELHGGTVTASSAGRDHGSVFTICLPAVTADAQNSVATLTLRGVSILAVDDDPQALEFVRRTLEQYGASVRIAASAQEARESIISDSPDVVVSDLLMPVEDGLTLMRKIRALDPQRGGRVPAVALTALARDADRRSALAAGYQMHVTKPIDAHELASAVARLARGDVDADGSGDRTLDVRDRAAS